MVIGGQVQDVGEIVAVRYQIARLLARSIHLERGWVRSIPLDQLTRHDGDPAERDHA